MAPLAARLALLPAVILLLGVGACGTSHPDSLTQPTSTLSGGTGNPTLVTLVNVDTSVSVTAGYTGTWNWPGQSVTLPEGAGFSNIRFNWYTIGNVPVAFGTLYILDREFTGVPSQLSPAMAGFVGKSESADNGVYVFPSSVTLKGGTKYWFYGDKQGSFVAAFDEDTYKHGDMYVTGYPTNPFHVSHASGRMVNGVYVPPPDINVDTNFRLQGTAK